MRKGFTIVELSIVVAVLAILLSFIAVKVNNPSSEAKIEKTQEIVGLIQKATTYFYDDTGGEPNSIQELWKNDDGSGNPIPGWSGPYLSPPNGNTDATALTHLPAGSEAGVECETGNYYRVYFKDFPESLCSLWDKNSDDGNPSTGRIRFSSGTCFFYLSFSDTVCK